VRRIWLSRLHLVISSLPLLSNIDQDLERTTPPLHTWSLCFTVYAPSPFPVHNDSTNTTANADAWRERQTPTHHAYGSYNENCCCPISGTGAGGDDGAHCFAATSNTHIIRWPAGLLPSTSTSPSPVLRFCFDLRLATLLTISGGRYAVGYELIKTPSEAGSCQEFESFDGTRAGVSRSSCC